MATLPTVKESYQFLVRLSVLSSFSLRKLSAIHNLIDVIQSVIRGLITNIFHDHNGSILIIVKAFAVFLLHIFFLYFLVIIGCLLLNKD